MPNRPPRPCRRCYRLPELGSRFCSEHRQPTGWERHQQGRTAHARGYGAPWRRFRDQVLAEEPCCRPCLAQGRTTPSTMVDHIIPKAAGGTDARSNLRGICRACHAAKTGRDRLMTLKPGKSSKWAPGETTRESGSFEAGIKASVARLGKVRD
jgi:5-methylcytosine-specific restriction enzyme A